MFQGGIAIVAELPEDVRVSGTGEGSKAHPSMADTPHPAA